MPLSGIAKRQSATFGRILYFTMPPARACWRSPLISLATRCFSSPHHVRLQTNPRAIWLATTTLRPRFFGDLGGHAAFYSSIKAERVLGWKHQS